MHQYTKNIIDKYDKFFNAENKDGQIRIIKRHTGNSVKMILGIRHKTYCETYATLFENLSRIKPGVITHQENVKGISQYLDNKSHLIYPLYIIKLHRFIKKNKKIISNLLKSKGKL